MANLKYSPGFTYEACLVHLSLVWKVLSCVFKIIVYLSNFKVYIFIYFPLSVLKDQYKNSINNRFIYYH